MLGGSATQLWQRQLGLQQQRQQQQGSSSSHE